MQQTVLGCTAAESTAQPSYGLSHIPIHNVDKDQDGARSAIGMGHSSRNLATLGFGL